MRRNGLRTRCSGCVSAVHRACSYSECRTWTQHTHTRTNPRAWFHPWKRSSLVVFVHVKGHSHGVTAIYSSQLMSCVGFRFAVAIAPYENLHWIPYDKKNCSRNRTMWPKTIVRLKGCSHNIFATVNFLLQQMRCMGSNVRVHMV